MICRVLHISCTRRDDRRLSIHRRLLQETRSELEINVLSGDMLSREDGGGHDRRSVKKWDVRSAHGTPLSLLSPSTIPASPPPASPPPRSSIPHLLLAPPWINIQVPWSIPDSRLSFQNWRIYRETTDCSVLAPVHPVLWCTQEGRPRRPPGRPAVFPGRLPHTTSSEAVVPRAGRSWISERVDRQYVLETACTVAVTSTNSSREQPCTPGSAIWATK